MGQMIEDAELLSNSFAVIGKASKEFADPNRIQLAQTELRDSTQTFLREDELRCIPNIRGKLEPDVRLSPARVNLPLNQRRTW